MEPIKWDDIEELATRSDDEPGMAVDFGTPPPGMPLGLWLACRGSNPFLWPLAALFKILTTRSKNTSGALQVARVDCILVFDLI